jgi:hypothetical protein
LRSVPGEENPGRIITLQLQNPRHHGQGNDEVKNDHPTPVAEKELKKIHWEV